MAGKTPKTRSYGWWNSVKSILWDATTRPDAANVKSGGYSYTQGFKVGLYLDYAGYRSNGNNLDAAKRAAVQGALAEGSPLFPDKATQLAIELAKTGADSDTLKKAPGFSPTSFIALIRRALNFIPDVMQHLMERGLKSMKNFLANGNTNLLLRGASLIIIIPLAIIASAIHFVATVTKLAIGLTFGVLELLSNGLGKIASGIKNLVVPGTKNAHSCNEHSGTSSMAKGIGVDLQNKNELSNDKNAENSIQSKETITEYSGKNPSKMLGSEFDKILKETEDDHSISPEEKKRLENEELIENIINKAL